MRPATGADTAAIAEVIRQMDFVEVGRPLTAKPDVSALLNFADLGACAAASRGRIAAFGALRRPSGTDGLRTELACIPGEPGAAGAILEELGGATGQIALFGTRERFRGRGTATALLLYGFDELERRGASTSTWTRQTARMPFASTNESGCGSSWVGAAETRRDERTCHRGMRHLVSGTDDQPEVIRHVDEISISVAERGPR